jgi:hypothetical protein
VCESTPLVALPTLPAQNLSGDLLMSEFLFTPVSLYPYNIATISVEFESGACPKNRKASFGPAFQGWAKAFSFHGYCPHPSNHNPITRHFTDMKSSVNATSFRAFIGTILENLSSHRRIPRFQASLRPLC